MNPPRTSHPRPTRGALESVFKRSREAVFIVDSRTGRIEASNQAAERLFGYPAAEMLGRSVRTLYHDARAAGAARDTMTRVAGRNGVVATRGLMRRRDGTVFDARERMISIDVPHEAGLVLWLVRAATESNVPIRSELVERDLLRMAVSRRDVEDKWTALLARLGREFDWHYAEVWTPRSGRLHLTAWWSSDQAPGMDEFIAVSRSYEFGPGEGLPGRVWRSRNIEWLADVNDKSGAVFRRSFIARRAGLRTWFAVPIQDVERVSHIALFAGRDPRRPDDDLIALTQEACRGIACVAALESPD